MSRWTSYFFNNLQWSSITHIYWSEKIEPVDMQKFLSVYFCICMCVTYRPRVSTLNSILPSVYLGEPISTTEKVNIVKSWMNKWERRRNRRWSNNRSIYITNFNSSIILMMMICLLDSQVYMDICSALNAFMHVYMRQLILIIKKTNERNLCEHARGSLDEKNKDLVFHPSAS
jgi:hypothetical protein